MEKIMILGAGPAQVPLIRAAKAMGLETVAATIPGDWPGIPEADAVTYTDIADPAAIAQAAEQYGVSGVATCCFETGLRALAYTCEKLGLPGISRDAAEISVDKLAMKRAFDKGGISSAPWRLLEHPSDLEAAIEALGFPMVVKAVDLQGSSGVYIVHDLAQAVRAFDGAMALTKKGYCLAEAFIPGENIGAEAFVQNGRVLFVLPDGTLSFTPPGGPNIPIGHYAPLDCPDMVRERICREVEAAIAACGFDNCAVNVDLVLNDGTPYIIELTARAGATCRPEIVSIHYGVDYYRMIIMAALGRDAGELFASRLPQPRAVAATMLRSARTGTVRSIRLPQTLPENVYDLHLIVRQGDSVRSFAGTRDRIGQLILSGDSVADCRRQIDSLLAQIEIEVQ